MTEPTLLLDAFECQNCGAPVGHGAVECGYCRTRYFIAADDRFLYVTPDEALLLRCPNCFTFTPLAGRCRTCGFILPRSTECDECKQTVALARNCRNCGNTLAEMIRVREDNDPRNPFVREIEALVRRRLTQANLNIPIQFHERLNSNLEIIVGNQAFPSVRQIQDPTIRGAIESAVEEWQSRK
ncbi:MAG TPA: hypothetical protein VIX58_07630 [Anaerolineae bacterium]